MTAKRLEGRLALITGASRGIGAAVAKRFAAEGAHVVLIARTVGALEELDDQIQSAGGTATLAPLNLNDLDKIDMVAASLFERFGALDILVGNAGMLGPLSPIGHIKGSAWENVFKLNVTANHRLLRACDSLLRRSDAGGRAVFTTCAQGKTPKAFWGAYAASKAALEAMVQSYAEETANTPVRACCVDPGIVATKLRAQAFPGEKPEDLAQPDDVAALFVEAVLQ